ncbi:sugar ABC transporter substrate-binding protein [Nocardioides flavus (ex Wang et al. 2016)]|uniref:Sugar ABC transporter substrate-binding protein n=1 Tax=Nocardioides flavus (ex Wang et al. 2016) TaxID=2058780 RepID=A0ABQ3HIP2_9ACTN|nr:extracellular solute-binding protein [Nocardioides flavus (ex Wang et al. 2016)]GHE15439.1 sugar ABC transporter substrate-binding protein [Nocardioides flavus (ex Wang et al. 2016)]
MQTVRKTQKTRRVRLATSAILALTLATTAAACGGGGDDEGTTADGKIKLTVATFNEFGYEELIEEYNAMQDDVVVEQKKAGTANEHQDNLYTKLAAGSGLSDIEAVEVDWWSALMEESDAFVDLSDPEVEGRWLDWKNEAATTPDGALIGYGTDIGPEGICYRADLFEKAGLPTDRDKVAELFTDWDSYFEAGRQFVDKVPDTAWYDSSGGTAQAMINQVEYSFEDEDNTVIAAENPEVKEVFETITANAADGLSTGLTQWSEDWTASFQDNGFATMACPGWMLGVIEGNAAGVEGWDIANVFPGGGGNWGGSYLTVPAQGEHTEESKELAKWLTAPEQQIKAFQAKGTFPSQVDALDDPALTGSTNEFFNDAPTGEILADRAEAVPFIAHKGPKFADINTAFQQAIQRVDEGQESADEAWDSFLADIGRLG